MDRVDTEETFLTVAEVAEMLKLNQQTVRNWIDQGSLPALRVGRRVRIKRSDFDRILEESYSGRPAQAPAASTPTPTGTSTPTLTAVDFWGGEPIGIAEPAHPGAMSQPAHPGMDSQLAHPSANPQTPDPGVAVPGGGGARAATPPPEQDGNGPNS